MASNPTPSARRKPTTGISERHSRFCPSLTGGKCSSGRKDGCEVAYRAFVYDQSSGSKIRKTFPTLAAAKAWRADATSQLNHGKRIAPSKRTLREAAEVWVTGATADPPTILNRSGVPYKPSALREYERNLRNYVLPDLGGTRLSDLRRGDLQALVDRLLGRGLSASKVRNVILPVRVIYRHALERDEVGINPTAGLRLPTGGTPRERAASATEAADLLAVLPDDVRAIYAVAFYGGLRRGELQALRWDNVNLADGVISVRRAWDEVAGEITPKSKKGTRKVPVTALLRDHLTELKARSRRDGSDLVFGREERTPFTPSHVRKVAADAWTAANKERKKKKLAPLVPIGLHECRHTFVSLLHDAGLSLERIGDYVGHSSSYMTDRYRHLLDGHEAEAVRTLDEYLARADTGARLAQVRGE